MIDITIINIHISGLCSTLHLVCGRNINKEINLFSYDTSFSKGTVGQCNMWYANLKDAPTFRALYKYGFQRLCDVLGSILFLKALISMEDEIFSTQALT